MIISKILRTEQDLCESLPGNSFDFRTDLEVYKTAAYPDNRYSSRIEAGAHSS